RLGKFSENRIGLKRGDVYLESFNPKWKRSFSDEAYLIFDELRDESLRLYHIGSTSVHGLDAKPIIDILGSVASLKVLDQNKHLLEKIGYEYKGEYGIKGRRYCVLYNPEKTTAFVHLHIFEHGDPEVEKHLNFRDHLRLSETARTGYLKHKKHLVEELKIPREKYSEAKNEIITEIQVKANLMSRSGRRVVIFGAAEGHKNTMEFLSEIYGDSPLEIIDLNSSVVDPYTYSSSRKDDFHKIIRKAIDADILVLATPVYWYAMSGAMKDFMDRFSNLMSGEHKLLGESLYGKRVQLLSTGYDLKLPLGFEVPFAATAIYFGMDYMGASYRSVR
ncbi:MAG: GrpB family protein, partial [Pseudobdellovibrionaceae bacterium]